MARLVHPAAPARLDLREEQLSATIWWLALPAILETLLFSAVHFADTLIVGWLHSESALAAALLGGVVMWLATAPFMALSAAATSLVARGWGEGDFESARRCAAQALAMAFSFALVIYTVGWLLAERILTAMGGEPEVVALGTAFLRVILGSILLGLPMMIANGILRGTGNTKTPLRISAIMNVTNIVISAALAFGWGPLPAMGLVGVAWGTVAARTLGGLMALSVLELGRSGIHVPLREFFTLRPAVLRRVWHLASPAMLERSLNSFAHLIFLTIVTMLGTTVLAAHNIAVQVESIVYMSAMGLGMAITAGVGQAVGAGQSAAAERVMRLGFRWTGFAALALGVAFALFARSGVVIFGATPDVLRLAAMALQIASLELVPMGWSIVLTGGLHGAGDTRSPLRIMIWCTILFRFGGVYLLAIALEWGLAGVWIGTAIFWAFRALLLRAVMHRGAWKEIHARGLA
ncbi:MATE family efflux transporter [Candidatus Sumerlaeota bacterium]|nr:MATE family efflux transporter [Candidatus Sumerlaeota bacterium]